MSLIKYECLQATRQCIVGRTKKTFS